MSRKSQRKPAAPMRKAGARHRRPAASKSSAPPLGIGTKSMGLYISCHLSGDLKKMDRAIDGLRGLRLQGYSRLHDHTHICGDWFSYSFILVRDLESFSPSNGSKSISDPESSSANSGHSRKTKNRHLLSWEGASLLTSEDGSKWTTLKPIRDRFAGATKIRTGHGTK